MEITDIKATHNNVIIQRIDEDEIRASGIILLNNPNSRDPVAKGKILSVGNCTTNSGIPYIPDCKVGDIVSYKRNAYVINIGHDMNKYFQVPISRVEAVLE